MKKNQYIAPKMQMNIIEVHTIMSATSPKQENVAFDPTKEVSGGLSKDRDEDYEPNGWKDGGLW